MIDSTALRRGNSSTWYGGIEPFFASVTPLPKTGGNTFYITINAADRSTEEIVDDLMPKLRLALDTL